MSVARPGLGGSSGASRYSAGGSLRCLGSCHSSLFSESVTKKLSTSYFLFPYFSSFVKLRKYVLLCLENKYCVPCSMHYVPCHSLCTGWEGRQAVSTWPQASWSQRIHLDAAAPGPDREATRATRATLGVRSSAAVGLAGLVRRTALHRRRAPRLAFGWPSAGSRRGLGSIGAACVSARCAPVRAGQSRRRRDPIWIRMMIARRRVPDGPRRPSANNAPRYKNLAPRRLPCRFNRHALGRRATRSTAGGAPRPPGREAARPAIGRGKICESGRHRVAASEGVKKKARRRAERAAKFCM